MSDQPEGGHKVRDLTPQEVAKGLKEGSVVLVDVREPNETAVERFPGAVHVPLSAFDPASLAAQEQGFDYDSHLAGGILAWKAAGLPTET